jgi:protoporphyrinogen oxidase
MLRGKFGNEYYNQVTLAWIWSKIQTRVASRSKGMIKEKLGYPIGSFGEVFDVLARLIEENNGAVHLKSAVSRIIVENDNFVGLEVSPLEKEPFVESFDAVVATTPSYIFPNLVPTLPKSYLKKLNDVDYLAAVLIVLVLDRPLSHVYWLNVADDSIPFVAVIEHTNLISADHYGGHSIVYLSNYLSSDSPLYNLSQEELLREYLPHLRKINIDFNESWILTSYHHRVRAAQPVIPVNYSAKIPDHRTPFKGIYLANTTQIYPEDRGTNYSVKMGKQVAEMVMRDYDSSN